LQGIVRSFQLKLYFQRQHRVPILANKLSDLQFRHIHRIRLSPAGCASIDSPLSFYYTQKSSPIWMGWNPMKRATSFSASDICCDSALLMSGQQHFSYSSDTDFLHNHNEIGVPNATVDIGIRVKFVFILMCWFQ